MGNERATQTSQLLYLTVMHCLTRRGTSFSYILTLHALRYEARDALYVVTNRPKGCGQVGMLLAQNQLPITNIEVLLQPNQS